MAENTLTNRIKERILAAYEKRREQVEVSVAEIAFAVVDDLDPVGQTPMLVRHCAVLEVRQMTREVLRSKTESDVTSDDTVLDLFGEALQKRYPVKRGGRECYVNLHCMTDEEGAENSQALRAEGQKKIKHADALDAYFAARKACGGFLQVGT